MPSTTPPAEGALMFYYRVTTESSFGAREDQYREFLRPAHLGEAVAAQVSEPGTTSVTIRKISQRDYIAATRPKD
jgi:hypothetical protein